jgi:hypothetical protein
MSPKSESKPAVKESRFGILKKIFPVEPSRLT